MKFALIFLMICGAASANTSDEADTDLMAEERDLEEFNGDLGEPVEPETKCLKILLALYLYSLLTRTTTTAAPVSSAPLKVEWVPFGLALMNGFGK